MGIVSDEFMNNLQGYGFRTLRRKLVYSIKTHKRANNFFFVIYINTLGKVL